METREIRVCARDGFSLIEAVIAILLGALLVVASWMGLAQQRRALEHMTRRAEGLATIRIARTSLARDISSSGDASSSAGADTIGLRIVRGLGLPCPVGGLPPINGSLPVQYDGIRAPNPDKDSIRGLTAQGSWVVADLIDVVGLDACNTLAGQRGLWLTSSGAIETLVYAEVFEAGSYHLSGRALRYRGPGGNRQPVSPENVASASRFLVSGPRVELVLTSDDAAPWVMSLGPRLRRW
jgi:type II secretory pathway component PulJ